MVLPEQLPWTEEQFRNIVDTASMLRSKTIRAPLLFQPLYRYQVDLSSEKVMPLSGHWESNYTPLTAGFARWMRGRLHVGEQFWFFLPTEAMFKVAFAEMFADHMILQTYVVLDQNQSDELYLLAEQQHVCFALAKMFDRAVELHKHY